MSLETENKVVLDILQKMKRMERNIERLQTQEDDDMGEIISPVTAFGEISTAENTPDIQLQFPYDINNNIVKNRGNQSGAVDQINNMARLQTGAAADSSAEMLSRDTIKYHPGQGTIVRFTAVFATGVANSTQVVGVGDTGDGFFFGYNGTVFGIRGRKGGLPEIRTLTITTKSATAENITITLNGNAANNVAVTDATGGGDTTTTANEIAAHDYSDIGRGWEAHAVGSTVIFISWCAGARGGAYSLSNATSAIGAFAQTELGIDDVETIVPQAEWNHDVMDGNGPSGMLLDPTKGNVYQIKYQWLGFGEIEFFIEDSVTGRYVLVHRIQYANANTSPSINNPTLPIYAGVLNGVNTSNLILFIGSMMGATEGKEVLLGPRHGANVTSATFSSGVETPVITLRNRVLYKGVLNRSNIVLSFAGLSQDGTKTATVLFRFNAVLTGASFAEVNADSISEIDIAAIEAVGGSEAFAQGIARTDKTVFQLTDEKVTLHPGDTLTISIIPNANNPDVTAAINWIDDL